MTTRPPIRVLIADDHPLVCVGLRTVISGQADMTVVAEARDGRQAVALFRQHRPDVALLDLRMPGMAGVEAIAAIHAEFPEARIAVLTTYRGDEEMYGAVHAGARGYLLKDASWQELTDAIRQLAAGGRWFPRTVARRLAERLPGCELTEREVQVLKRVATGDTNKEIAGALAISPETVKWHVKVILEKLGVRDRTEAATAAYERGILHADRS